MTRGQTMAEPGLGAEQPRPDRTTDHPHGDLQPHSRRPDAALLAVGAFAVLTALAALALNAAYNQGRVVPPLDDVYIHLQYARQIGLGEFLRYQPGAPRTTGASSLLYVVLLGLASVVVPTGLLLYAALALGVVCFTGTVVLVALLGRALGSRAPAPSRPSSPPCAGRCCGAPRAAWRSAWRPCSSPGRCWRSSASSTRAASRRCRGSPPRSS